MIEMTEQLERMVLLLLVDGDGKKKREEGEENLPFEIITVNVYFMFHIYGNAVYLNYCTSVIMFKLFHALTLLKRVTETSENK